MPNGKIPFDPKSPDLEAVRQIVLERLRRDTAWQQLDNSGDGFAPFVEYVAPAEFEQRNGRHVLLFMAQEVFWQFVVEGILAPGMDSSNLQLPWFHITKYGRDVLASSEPPPYDPTGYLARVRERTASPDPTVSRGSEVETDRVLPGKDHSHAGVVTEWSNRLNSVTDALWPASCAHGSSPTTAFDQRGAMSRTPSRKCYFASPNVKMMPAEAFMLFWSALFPVKRLGKRVST
jgi:hypothetical protein